MPGVDQHALQQRGIVVVDVVFVFERLSIHADNVKVESGMDLDTAGRRGSARGRVKHAGEKQYNGGCVFHFIPPSPCRLSRSSLIDISSPQVIEQVDACRPKERQ